MIGENRFFPEKREALTFGKCNLRGEMQCLFVHESKLKGHFDEARQKWLHIADNFANLVHCRRKVFIPSNIQSNLLEFTNTLLEQDALRLCDETIASVRAALESRFHGVELHCVVYDDRHSLTSAAPIDSLHTLAKDDSKVRGNTSAWASTLTKIIVKTDSDATSAALGQ
ncbi:MAG: hypothetical protein RLZZ399_1957 [Verrucomicrobiota bacterium]|jgi:hypothetical protein